ncbi:helix-turn-helix transcriptional regulator [Clostridium perfringens]|uniref:helix-turn-helix transcriptional regulator n=1 Tax=Clostridium perfringens TaxID=1502 RepID=UPI00375418D9
MIVKNKIKYYRKKYNITQEELAKEMNCSKQYISKVENENVNISIGLALNVTRAIKELTTKKSFGLQTVKIQVEDIFYL